MRRTFGPLALRRAADLALLMLWSIVVTGATVRLTGSGLGCPEWPVCNAASPLPGLEHHALIEFVNRVWALPTLLATIAAWWIARRQAAPRRDLRIATGLSLVAVLANAFVGGLTVKLGLPAGVVSVHFLISVASLAAASYASWASRQPAGVTPWPGVRALLRSPRAQVLQLGVAAALLTCLGAIVLGVLTTAAGPHSGAEPGVVVERVGDWELAVTLHARVAYAFAFIVVALTVWRRRTRAGARDLGLLTALVVVQVALGEVQYRTGLPWGVVLGHVATAGLVWITTCRVAFACLAGEPQPGRVAGGDGAVLAGAVARRPHG